MLLQGRCSLFDFSTHIIAGTIIVLAFQLLIAGFHLLLELLVGIQAGGEVLHDKLVARREFEYLGIRHAQVDVPQIGLNAVGFFEEGNVLFFDELFLNSSAAFGRVETSFTLHSLLDEFNSAVLGAANDESE